MLDMPVVLGDKEKMRLFFGEDSTRYRGASIKEYWERIRAGRKGMER